MRCWHALKHAPTVCVEWLRKTIDTNKKSQGVFDVLTGGSVNVGLLQRILDHNLRVLLGMHNLPLTSNDLGE